MHLSICIKTLFLLFSFLIHLMLDARICPFLLISVLFSDSLLEVCFTISIYRCMYLPSKIVFLSFSVLSMASVFWFVISCLEFAILSQYTDACIFPLRWHFPFLPFYVISLLVSDFLFDAASCYICLVSILLRKNVMTSLVYASSITIF